MAAGVRAPVVKAAEQISEHGGQSLQERLLGPDAAWEAYCDSYGRPEEEPTSIRLRQLTPAGSQGRLISYKAEWRDRLELPDQEFTLEIRGEETPRVFRYPEDPYLPSLETIATPARAHSPMARYVRVRPHTLAVEAVRYRPTRRAVLRYALSWRRGQTQSLTMFVRVMRPDGLPTFLATRDRAAASEFAVPAVLGHWDEGGTAWLEEVQGKTLRESIFAGDAPEPAHLLDSLASLWAGPRAEDRAALDLPVLLRWTHEQMDASLDEDGRKKLSTACERLLDFAAAWRPAGPTHNDFHDDQVIVTPAGRLALVDFEEVGPGEPQLDVGNLLAHLRWLAHFTTNPAYAAYHDQTRALALWRFGWDAAEAGAAPGVLPLPARSEPAARLSERLAGTHVGGARSRDRDAPGGLGTSPPRSRLQVSVTARCVSRPGGYQL